MQQLDWLGVCWDTTNASLSLVPDNALRTVRQIWWAYLSKTLSRRQCESVWGAHNFATPVLLMGRLKHCCLA